MMGWLQITPPKLERRQRAMGTASPHASTEAEPNRPPMLFSLSQRPAQHGFPQGAHATTDEEDSVVFTDNT